MALTAAGLALPWVSRITWPTNQPMAWGLALTACAWPGLAAIRRSMMASSAPVSLTWARPCFSTISVGRPLAGPHVLEDLLGDLGGDDSLFLEPHQLGDVVGPRSGCPRSPARPWPGGQQVVGHPVGHQLGVAPFGGRLEKVGPRRLDDQHAGVVGGEAVLGLQPALLASGSSGRLASIALTHAGSRSSGSRSGSGK